MNVIEVHTFTEPLSGMSHCYRLEAAPERSAADRSCRPLLPRVDLAVVLTMHGSERLLRLQQAECPLYRLCEHTVLQINRGYRACPKPQVTNTVHDISHAYTEVARWTRGMGNVLILEDDAHVMPGASDADFALVDEFVATHDFDVYSLGSIGANRPDEWGSRHRKFLGFWGAAQAVVWSPRAREALLQRVAAHRLPACIDAKFLAQLPRCFTLDRPLVVQTFPTTANAANWCILCTGGLMGRVDRAFCGLAHPLFRLVGLDRSVHGWHWLYAYNSVALPLAVCLAVAVLFSAFRLGRKIPMCLHGLTRSLAPRRPLQAARGGV